MNTCETRYQVLRRTLVGASVAVIILSLPVVFAGHIVAGEDSAPRPVPEVIDAASAEAAATAASMWEPSEGVMFPLTTVACCEPDESCSLMPSDDCTAAGGSEVAACLGDCNDNGSDDACESCYTADTPLPEDSGFCTGDGDCDGVSTCIGDRCYVPKNRYISFEPGNAGECVALKVMLTDSDDFPACEGESWWVGEPDTNGIARLQDTPEYRDWTLDAAVIHVGDKQIVPVAAYEVRAIAPGCDAGNPVNFSAPLALPTVPRPSPRFWADIVGMRPGAGQPWDPPDGVLNFDDITAILEAYQGLPEAPPITWADLMREIPDKVVNGRDLLAILQAFKGYPYPGPSPCAELSVEPPTVAKAPQDSDPTLTCVMLDMAGDPLPVIETPDPWPVYATVPTQNAKLDIFIESVGVELGGLAMYQTYINVEPDPQQDSFIRCEDTPVALDLKRNSGDGSVGPICDQGPDDPDVDIDTSHMTNDNYDYVFFFAGTRIAQSNCLTRQAASAMAPDGVVVPDAPPAYLATYTLDVPIGAGGGTFNIRVQPEEPTVFAVTEFLGGNNSANDDSLVFQVAVPCAELRVAFDCNENLRADDEDIVCGGGNTCDEIPGSYDCNGNGIPDECEIPAETGEPGEFYCDDAAVGCPEICDEQGENCVVFCDPDCNGNGVPDECDIDSCWKCEGGPNPGKTCKKDTEDEDCEGGSCVLQDLACNDCNDNCIPDACEPDCDGDVVPDDCELDCNADGCPDDCETMVVPGLECDGGVAEQDCDNNGICNGTEIMDCPPDDPSCADCNGNWIPDGCDIADCPAANRACQDCNRNLVPDECDIADCPESDPCCDDCNGNGRPDLCDVLDNCDQAGDDDPACQDCNRNLVPDGCDITLGTSCDVVDPTGEPDECALFCARGRTVEQGGYPCADYLFPDAGTDVVSSVGGAFKIEWLDPARSDTELTDLQGPVTITRGAPHFHGDPDDTFANGEPCVTPPGFPGAAGTARGREVHTEIISLNLTGTGISVVLDTTEASLGEAQGTCADFPVDSFFDVFIEIATGAETLHNDTPIVMRSRIGADLTAAPGFDWSFTDIASVYVNDASSPAVPLFDDAGVHRGYLTSARLGGTTVAPAVCETAPGLAGPVSFAIDGTTDGVLINPPATANHVKDDKDASVPERTITVYTSEGDPPDGFPDFFVNTNARVAGLVGSMGGVGPDYFVAGDAINSLSFGRDGTSNQAAEEATPVLYFSVDASSRGEACTSVSLEAPVDGTDRSRAAADVFMAATDAFGAFEGPVSPPCSAGHTSCLVTDQTTLGLGPFAVDPPGQENRGLNDNVTALELSAFPDDRAYFTFTPGSGSQFVGNQATIYVYDRTADPDFEFESLQVYATRSDLGLAFNDVIDALALSDANILGCEGETCVEADTDEALFSLAVGSPTLWGGDGAPGLAGVDDDDDGETDELDETGLGDDYSPADIFHSDFDGTYSVLASAADMGLLPTDNIDAIDVGVANVIVDCNSNGIADQCDLDRGFSADVVNPDLDVPDECEPICDVVSSQPQADTLGAKSRYLSIAAGDPGLKQAVRVTLTDLPDLYSPYRPFSQFNGTHMWVGEPHPITELPGESENGAHGNPPPWFMGARLCTQPFFTEWGGRCECGGTCVGGFKEGTSCSTDADCQGVVHVFDDEIVPDATYTVEVVDETCYPSHSDRFSDGLAVVTATWGDVTGDCGVTPCTPPDGVVDFIDIAAMVDKFTNRPGAPIKPRTDLDPEIPNRIIDFLDISRAVDAFKNADYPFGLPDLADCP